MATEQEINLRARRAEVVAELSILVDEANALQRAEGNLGNQIGSPEFQRLSARIRQLRAERSSIDQQLAALPPTPTTSSGSVAASASIARDDNATVQTPNLPVTATDSNSDVSNAVSLTNDDNNSESFDIGTDGRIRSINETQSNPPPTAETPISQGSGDDASVSPNSNGDTPTLSGGAGAGNDDAEKPNVTQTSDVVKLANKTDRAINPEPNVLDICASYTYSISLYLMSPNDFRRLMESNRRYIPGYLLMAQSAGAPQQSGEVPVTQDAIDTILAGGVSLSQGRNQFFPLDYYIDDLEIESFNPGKGTNGPHNVSQLKFKITEPNGITFISNLNKAVEQYITQAGGESAATKNGQYSAQNYLMVIRFYGYDQDGNQINGNDISIPGLALSGERSDSRAIVEKFIPFQFSAIKFRIANKLVEYQCEATAVQNVIGTAQSRGVIPFNIELSATTLQNLFNGNQKFAQTQNGNLEGRENASSQGNTSPDKASAAPSPDFATGLAQALNKYQQEHVNDGTYTHADIYKIVISHPEIANSSIVPPGEINRLAKPMTKATTGAQAKDGEKQSVNNNAQTVSATAGQSIIQFIQQAVQRSDFILKQQTKIIVKDNNGKDKEVPQSNGARTTAWFTINVEAKPRGNGYYDPKRNDYAYEITYEIAPYAISQMKSEYFPKGRFRGVQKRYAYWFTGENTSVLNFEQDFNYLYYLTVNSRQNVATYNVAAAESIMGPTKKSFAPNSPQSNQGQKGNTYEAGANAADYLYSPGDQGQVSMTIIGDPAWIAQGTVWKGVRSTNKTDLTENDVYFDAFLNDGTINYDAREPLFEIVFKKPTDYNLNTGTLKGLT